MPDEPKAYLIWWVYSSAYYIYCPRHFKERSPSWEPGTVKNWPIWDLNIFGKYR